MSEVAGSDGHDAQLGESDTRSAGSAVVEWKWKTSLQLHIRDKSGQNMYYVQQSMHFTYHCR